jgi:hypothetical protein
MATDTFGLDKAARLQAKRDAKAKANAPQPLEPPFPFTAVPFDPVFFGMTADPQPVAGSADNSTD